MVGSLAIMSCTQFSEKVAWLFRLMRLGVVNAVKAGPLGILKKEFRATPLQKRRQLHLDVFHQYEFAANSLSRVGQLQLAYGRCIFPREAIR